MTGNLLIIVVGLIVLRGLTSGCDAYDAFLRGAERGMRSAVRLLPALFAMLLMLRMLQTSGLTELLTRLLMPLTRGIGLPQEVTPLLLLRPFTGSGSLAALEEVFRRCGVDSRAGRIASALMGSSETIFYTLTIYTGAAGIRKVPGAMTASLMGYAAAVAVCLLLM